MWSNDENKIAIEFKGWWNNDDEKDIQKLKDLTKEKIQELTEEEQLLIMEKVLRLAKLSCVWFQIGDSSGGGYIICMYYTNPNNDPRNGADL
jgi:hypothetical protein